MGHRNPDRHHPHDHSGDLDHRKRLDADADFQPNATRLNLSTGRDQQLAI